MGKQVLIRRTEGPLLSAATRLAGHFLPKSACVVAHWFQAAAALICVALLANCASSSPTREDRTARSQLDILDALAPVDVPVADWLPLSIAGLKSGSQEIQVLASGQSKVPVRIDDKAMRLASLSKLAVAYGAMALVEDGVLDLDEDVSTYLGWTLRHPDFPDIPITTRQLLSHQSSLADGASYQSTLSLSLEDMMRDPLFYLEGKAPGTYFVYANIGYGVLATVMEAASGKRFDILMEEQVFGPAGLDIGFNWHGVSLSRQAQALPVGRIGQDGEDNSDKPTILIETLEAPVEDGNEDTVDAEDQQPDEGAASIAAADSIFIEIDADPIIPSPTRAQLRTYVPGTNATVFSPQGGLRASMRDLVRLGELLQTRGKINGKRVLQTATVKKMMRPAWRVNKDEANGDTYGGLMTAYGLGVQIYEPNQSCFETKRERYYGHFGEAYGFLGGVMLDPKTQDIFAYAIPYTPKVISAALSDCSGLYKWEEQFLKTVLAPTK